ncbi:MAG: coth protein-domain-containing protein [Podila humilis]|nr:MAG: coth protein-domain-containing protein [Podila humilis]
MALVTIMKLLFGLATLASVAFADITFNVVGYPSSSTGSLGVNIGGSITRLSSDENTFPVWSGSVPGTDGNVQYSYVELSSSGTPLKSVGFTRKLQDPARDTETLNEFFERPQTVWEFPKIPYTYLATYPSKTKAFKHKQIATIHVTAPVAHIAELNASPYSGQNYTVDFRFINSVHPLDLRQVVQGTHQTFFLCPNIKLRSMVMDPTMMREKLYIDMLNSAGIPTQQSAWVRLLMNNEPYGLYLMVDDIKKSFLKQTVHGGDGKIERGSLVQMNAWNENKAMLEYKDDMTSDYNTETNYIYRNLGHNLIDDPLEELIDLMRDLNSTLLAPGAFDNYWLSASNYTMYKNPTMVFRQVNWYDFRSDGDRPLVRKLIIENKAINGMFEQILKELVSMASKMQSLKPRIEMYNQMLSVDAK